MNNWNTICYSETESATVGSDTVSGSSTSIETSFNSNTLTSHESSLSMNYSILPSYQMHQSIVAKQVALQHDQLFPVPSYNLIPRTLPEFQEEEVNAAIYGLNSTLPASSSTGLSSSSSIGVMSSNQTSYFSSSYSASELTSLSSYDDLESTVPSAFTSSSSTSSNEKILDIHHKLKSKTNSSLSMSMHFTKNTGKLGVMPTFIDANTYEYTTGDHIHGFVIVENTSHIPIPFSTFYVLFEGNILNHSGIFSPRKKVTNTNNFLQSIDLCASSSYDNEGCSVIDPIDNSSLTFGENQLLYPGIKYKRFFSFKVPQHLLDSNCNQETLNCHHQLPPSLDGETTYNLSFINTSLGYSIQAKFVAPDYESNEYITLDYIESNIRIVPLKTSYSNDNNHKIHMTYQVENLKSRLEEKIRQGKELRGLLPPSDIDIKYEYSQDSSNEKGFNEFMNSTSNTGFHESTIAHFKKSSFGSAIKQLGSLSISIPVYKQSISYIPPLAYRTGQVSTADLDSWNIHIPIHLRYESQGDITKNKLPEITNISASLVTFSIMSDNYPIPIEFDHDMLFNNDTGEEFDALVQGPFQNLYRGLVEQARALEQDQFTVESQLLEDVRSLSSLRIKKNVLDIEDIKVYSSSKLGSNGIPWTTVNKDTLEKKCNISLGLSNCSPQDRRMKDLQVSLNLTSSQTRKSMSKQSQPAYDKYAIIPEYQNCFSGRLYYLQVNLLILNGEIITTKIPLSVEKRS